MTRCYTVDADSHVEESEETWAFLEPPYAARPPLVVDKRGAPGLTVQDAFWVIDGRVLPHLRGRGATVYATPVVSTLGQEIKTFSVASQTLSDPAARVADLDRAGIDVQVLYPTIFLERLTDDDGFQTALMRSYNTWLAGEVRAGARPPEVGGGDAAAPRAGRHRRAAPGARAGGRLRGDVRHGRRDDAARGGVRSVLGRSRPPEPAGRRAPAGATRACRRAAPTCLRAQIVGFTLPVMMAFFSFLGGGILARHPDLRVCFLEAGADWLPYMIQRMDQYYSVDARLQWARLADASPSDYLKRGNVYFTCEGDEKLLPIVLDWLGEDQMMASADMPHMEARENSLQDIAERDDLTAERKRKILGANARRFYGL